MTEKQQKSWVIAQLRRSSYKWPPRAEAERKARVERGKYKCASCNKIVGPRDKHMDHIIPVVDPLIGFTDWNSFIPRLLCLDYTGFQCLCIDCHSKKTLEEATIRVGVRAEKKALQKKKKKV